jgi:hypothetical protein
MKKNEPLCAEKVCPPKEDLLDFRILKHFSHHSGRLYSPERWAVTGEAGPFLDPFYSPGSDFIALGNTWLSDLILRDMSGEDIALRAEIYEKAHLSWFDSWLPIYQDKYKLMGNTQIMVVKIFWDWAIYWSVACLLFTNKGFTDMKTLKELFASETSLGKKFGMLNKRMQDLFIQWQPHEHATFTNRYIDPLDLDFLRAFQQGIEIQHGPKRLLEVIRDNMNILEQVAASIYLHINNQVNGGSVNTKINPYTISLTEPVDTESENAIAPSAEVMKDVQRMWFYERTPEPANV